MKFLTKEQFVEMWNLQDKLNTFTSGPEWRTAGQDWGLAMMAEVQEIIDYKGWKWWKDAASIKTLEQMKGDKQLLIEIVDLFHFDLSLFMQISALAEKTAEDGHALLLEYVEDGQHGEGPIDLIFVLKRMTAAASQDNGTISGLDILLEAFGFTWQDVYEFYIAKSALNIFRQENGYKEGTYRKMWESSDGIMREDNYFLEIIVKECLASDQFCYDKIKHDLAWFYAGNHLLPDFDPE